MKLNAAETLLMNNPVRALVQRFFEAPVLRKLCGRLDGARVLEVGCGRGLGVQILLDQFGAAEVCAIDLDTRQIQRAQRRVSGRPGRVMLAVGDAEHLPFPNACFDAVFDFGILHHAPAWQAAVAEIRRVLKPSGHFLFEEVTRKALNRPLNRMLFDHPKENRFSEEDFLAVLADCGLMPAGMPRRILRGDIFIGMAGPKTANAAKVR